MDGINQLAMAEIGRRSRIPWLGYLFWSTLALICCYVFYRNVKFLEDGMLRPDFEIIHRAYDFNLVHLPISLLSGAILFFVFGTIFKKARKVAFFHTALWAFFAVDLFAVRYYVTSIEPERLIVREVQILTPKLTERIRIIHISDIQAGEIGEYQRKVFEKILALKPDLVLNTGDYLQIVPPAIFEEELDKLVELTKLIKPRLGVYGVFGDTELEMYRVPKKQVEPLGLISSSSIRIDTGSGILSIHGLSLYESNKPDWALRSIQSWVDQSKSNEFRILMGHSPNYALGVSNLPIDLCLAGHTMEVKSDFHSSVHSQLTATYLKSGPEDSDQLESHF